MFVWVEEPYLFWLLAGLGVYLTGISKSGFAGSSGVIAVPMMAMVIEPQAAVAMLLPVLLFVDIFNIKWYWRDLELALLKPLLVGGGFGLAVGVIVFQMLSADLIRLLLGLFSMIMAFKNIFINRKIIASPSVNKSMFWGGVSAFTSFVAHAGGPPLGLYLLSFNAEKALLLSTASVFFAIMNFLKLPLYFYIGQLNYDIGFFVLLMLPLAWLGAKSGVWLKDGLSNDLYLKLINVMLLIVGIQLVFGVLF